MLDSRHSGPESVGLSLVWPLIEAQRPKPGCRAQIDRGMQKPRLLSLWLGPGFRWDWHAAAPDSLLNLSLNHICVIHFWMCRDRLSARSRTSRTR